MHLERRLFIPVVSATNTSEIYRSVEDERIHIRTISNNYSICPRKIKGEGNVRQKMGRRLKTKQERLEFVVEILKKLKL